MLLGVELLALLPCSQPQMAVRAAQQPGGCGHLMHSWLQQGTGEVLASMMRASTPPAGAFTAALTYYRLEPPSSISSGAA